MMKKVISYTWLVLVALFMYIPVAVLAVYSFTESDPKPDRQWIHLATY